MKFRLVWIGEERAEEACNSEAVRPIERENDLSQYEQRVSGLVRRIELNGRTRTVPIANFVARIVRDVVVDDGADQIREFEIVVETPTGKLCFQISAGEFSRMNWVLDRLGPQAIIYPGQHQHARAAIQCLSGNVQQQHTYSHLGWRWQGAGWIYLHTGGAIGTNAIKVGVRLPAALEGYGLELPSDDNEMVRAVRASLEFLSVADDDITFPLLTSVWRAPFGSPDFSIFLAGRSGSFKTALGALCQQHFGATMDASHLPGNFASTGNALEELAFRAKDALIVVDDFVHVEGIGDAELQRTAERLFRSTGNGQGRSRLKRAAELQAPHPPRAMILATGEEVPRGTSVRARMLIVEVSRQDVDMSRLTASQVNARKGNFSRAMAAFLRWMATQYDNVSSEFQTRAAELRLRFSIPSAHARFPAAVAQLQAAWETWLRFAIEIGAINDTERADLSARCKIALLKIGSLQSKYQLPAHPAQRFIALIRVAIRSGHAYVADRNGHVPHSSESWGWQRVSESAPWLSQGALIGWIDGPDVFLDPRASLDIVEKISGTEGLRISPQALRRSLNEQGFLASVDTGRKMLLVRKTLAGVPRQVLHFKASDLSDRLRARKTELSEMSDPQRGLLRTSRKRDNS